MIVQAPAGPRSDVDSDEENEGEGGRVSKKKRKMLSRLKIAALKQLCPRPEVVEVWDVTAPDPQLLVYLKVRPWLRCICVNTCKHARVHRHLVLVYRELEYRGVGFCPCPCTCACCAFGHLDMCVCS